jgi:ketosteroid isomerase-like protein
MKPFDDMQRFATRFFDAIEQGDMAVVRDCFAPGASIWHNTDEIAVSTEHTLKVLSGLIARIQDRRYADRRLTIVSDGFWQQHVLTGVRVSDDVLVRLPCAIFCRVIDGKITHIDEYFDSAHIAQFR